MARRRRRRYYLNTSVPLAAYYGSPGARAWLQRHGRESVYTKVLRAELRRAASLGYLPSVSAVLDMLRLAGAVEASVDIGRLRREARTVVKRYGLPRRFEPDAMHVLAARELRLRIVSYDRDIEHLADILGVPYVRPPGEPYGPRQRVRGPGRGEGVESSETG